MKNIHRKLALIQSGLKEVAKTGRNNYQKYDYITEKDVLDILRPLCAEQKLTLVISCKDYETGSFENQSKITRTATVTVALYLTDSESGEFIEINMPGYAEDTGDKAIYKAITGATKYAYWKAFGLATGDDPENENGNGAQATVLTKQAPLQETPAQPKPEDERLKVAKMALANGWSKDDLAEFAKKYGPFDTATRDKYIAFFSSTPEAAKTALAKGGK